MTMTHEKADAANVGSNNRSCLDNKCSQNSAHRRGFQHVSTAIASVLRGLLIGGAA